MGAVAHQPPTSGNATLTDLMNLQPGHDFELLDGYLIHKALPLPSHGAIQGKVFALVQPYDGDPRPGHPGGWFFSLDAESYLDVKQGPRPDVLGWRLERIGDCDDRMMRSVRPDWVCEVVSASHRSRDIIQKRRIYADAGIPHYWLVDPADLTLTILRLGTGGYEEVARSQLGDIVRPEPFESVELAVAELFPRYLR